MRYIRCGRNGIAALLIATGAGSDVMKVDNNPFVFGLLTSTIVVLIVLPVIYAYVRRRSWQGHANSIANFRGSIETLRNRLLCLLS
jgi:hypothetical protein